MKIDEYRQHRDGDKRNDAARKPQLFHFFAEGDQSDARNKCGGAGKECPKEGLRSAR